MKPNHLFTIVLLLLAKATFAQSASVIDTKRSVIKWTGHAEIGTYAPAGTLNIREGNIAKNGTNLSGANLIVDMKSMKQSNEQLLEHLRSADFFNVEKYPISIIKIDKIVNGTAYGLLTIKDKTVNFQCPVFIKKEAELTMITGNTVIDRTKFGITYNSGSFFSGLGDKAIRNTFDIEFSIVVQQN